MTMTTSDKIVIGATGVVAVSAITMIAISKKYDNATKAVLSELQDIDYILSRSREDIIAGNKEIIDGNKILRDIVKKSAEDLSNNTK